MTTPDRLFLVDDNDAVRDALGIFLEHQQFAVETFPSAEAFLERVSDRSTGVLILDMCMQGMSGLDLQAQLNACKIRLPIIFITGHGNVHDSVTAMKRGAADFIEKPFENEELLESIRQVLIAEEKRNEHRIVRASLLENYAKLTPREQEVMQYIVEGISNKQLAIVLDVSTRTIEVHRSRVMTKMGAASLAELVRMSLLMQETG